MADFPLFAAVLHGNNQIQVSATLSSIGLASRGRGCQKVDDDSNSSDADDDTRASFSSEDDLEVEQERLPASMHHSQESALHSAASALLGSLTGELPPHLAMARRCNSSGLEERTVPTSAPLPRRKMSNALQDGSLSPLDLSPASHRGPPGLRQWSSHLSAGALTQPQDETRNRLTESAAVAAKDLQACVAILSQYIELEPDGIGAGADGSSQPAHIAFSAHSRAQTTRVLAPHLPRNADGTAQSHGELTLMPGMSVAVIEAAVAILMRVLSAPDLSEVLIHGCDDARASHCGGCGAERSAAVPLWQVPLEALRMTVAMSQHNGLKLEMLRKGVLPKLLGLLGTCHARVHRGTEAPPTSAAVGPAVLRDASQVCEGEGSGCAGRCQGGAAGSRPFSEGDYHHLLDALRAGVQCLSNFTAAEEFRQWALQDGLARQLVTMLGDMRLPTALREDAARSLKNIALDDDIRTSMAQHGAIETLADACLAAQHPGTSPDWRGAAGGSGEGCSGSEGAPDRYIRLREQAARGLGNLAVCDRLEGRIVATPAVSALIGLLAEGDEAASDAALGSLANLVGNEDMRLQFVGCGGIELLHGPITGDNDELCKHAGWTLASIAVDPALSDDVVARGGLPLLIRYAQSPNPVYQEEAAWGLANISSVSQHAVPLMHAGIIPPMVALTRSEVQGVRMQALWTLANLAVHQDFRLQISADGAIPALVHCLARLGAEDEHCLVQAARALSNLIVATENRRQVVEEDGIQSLLRCASFDSEAVQEAVTRVLVNLSYEAHIGRLLIRRGALPVVARLLGSPSEKVQQEAAWVAVNVSLCSDAEPEPGTPDAKPARGLEASRASSSAAIHGAMHAQGEADGPSTAQPAATFGEEIVMPLMRLLGSDNLRIQEQAVWALVNISRWQANKMRMIESGLLDKLVKLGRSTSDEVQAASGQLITSLGGALTPTSRRAMFGQRVAIVSHRGSKARGRNSPLTVGIHAASTAGSGTRGPSKLGPSGR